MASKRNFPTKQEIEEAVAGVCSEGALDRKVVIEKSLGCYGYTAEELRDRSCESLSTRLKSLTGVVINEMLAASRLTTVQDGRLALPAPVEEKKTLTRTQKRRELRKRAAARAKEAPKYPDTPIGKLLAHADKRYNECRAKKITEEQYAQHPLPDDQCVKVTSRFDENNTVYVTDRFVVAINNQMNAAVEYLETEKPYDDAFGQRNDIVLQSVNEGIFSTDPYKSEPSLRDGAIWRASGADNDLKTWNPAFRRMGWQTKNAPIEFTLPAGTPLSNGGTSDGSTTRMLLPLYSDSLALSICAYTDDYGETWAYSDPIAGLGNIQGNLVMKEDGTLYQYFRSGKLDGKNGRLDWKLTRSESHDYGVTWENIYVEPYLRNDGGVGLDVTSDGKWVLPHNQDAKEDLRSGCRNSVTLSVSSDEGQSWKSIMLDTAAQENGSYTGMDYQYPGVICTSSGWIVVAYTNGGRGGPSQVMRSTMLQESELDRLLSMDLNVAETAKLQAGETMQLQPKLTLDGQEVQLAEDDLIYRTSGTAIATVDGNGLVTAVADGQAKIIFTSKTYGTIGECLLTVGEDSSSGGGSDGTLWGARQQYADEFGF